MTEPPCPTPECSGTLRDINVPATMRHCAECDYSEPAHNKPRPRTDELVRPGFDGHDTLTEEQLRDMVDRAPVNTLYVSADFGRNVADIVGWVGDVVYRDNAVWVTWTPLEGKHHEGLVLALAAVRRPDGGLVMKGPGLIPPANKIQPEVTA